MRKLVLGSCCIVLIGTIVFSVWWFSVKHGQALSTDMALWGSFGSFLAGSIGVTFGLATVWMLAETLKLQRKELVATRQEMKDTRQVHQASVNSAKKQYDLMKADYSRRNFDIYVAKLVNPIEKTMESTRIVNNREITTSMALKAGGFNEYFEYEFSVLEFQFYEIAKSLSDYKITNENRVALVDAISRLYLVFELCCGNKLFRYSNSEMMDGLIKFYLDVRRDVRPLEKI